MLHPATITRLSIDEGRFAVRRMLGTNVDFVDSNRPRPVIASLADRCFLLGVDALDGAWYCIERSGDLRNWSAVCTNQVIQGAIHFVDADGPGAATGFYRAAPTPEPVQN